MLADQAGNHFAEHSSRGVPSRFSIREKVNAMDNIASFIPVIVSLAVLIVVIAGVWKTFEKAGKPGWAAIIPIYNMIVLLEVARRPIWWFILMFIPIVGIVIAIIVSIDVAKNFGKEAGFGLGLAFLGFIFYPILGFGDARYQAA
jgi:hypothetical protein